MNYHSIPKITALLPLKLNSTRVPGKNFRDLNGKPLFQVIIDSLLKVDEIDQIIINTDARHMLIDKGLTLSDKIKIRDRKSEICGDDVSMNLVLADDITNVESDVYVMTHTTNPFLSHHTIKKAISCYIKNVNTGSADSLFQSIDFNQDFMIQKVYLLIMTPRTSSQPKT